MKTLFKYLCASFLVCCLIACETDVPETDTVAPTFSLKITGDGFDRTFTQDDTFDNLQLNLRAGISYDFILGGVDQGGVRQVQFQYSPISTPISTTIPSPWTENNNGFSSTIRFNGDRNNAFTAQLLSGTFTATLGSEEIIAETFYIRVEDFGGESGPPFNITEAVLNIVIANHPTAVVTM
ncbi:hypothetical protein ACFO3O_08135 [Dokdonia ponticola]|uniref:Uncharacterized protein n=1 Tax=Dokdonia ponticola TaxID=2041041 RepID=A0ABV9HUM8_9FLAO